MQRTLGLHYAPSTFHTFYLSHKVTQPCEVGIYDLISNEETEGICTGHRESMLEAGLEPRSVLRANLFLLLHRASLTTERTSLWAWALFYLLPLGPLHRRCSQLETLSLHSPPFTWQNLSILSLKIPSSGYLP